MAIHDAITSGLRAQVRKAALGSFRQWGSKRARRATGPKDLPVSPRRRHFSRSQWHLWTHVRGELAPKLRRWLTAAD